MIIVRDEAFDPGERLLRDFEARPLRIPKRRSFDVRPFPAGILFEFCRLARPKFHKSCKHTIRVRIRERLSLFDAGNPALIQSGSFRQNGLGDASFGPETGDRPSDP